MDFEKLAFIDFETTNVDPNRAYPLSMAVVLVHQDLSIRYSAEFFFPYAAPKSVNTYWFLHQHNFWERWEKEEKIARTEVFDVTLSNVLPKAFRLAGFSPHYDRIIMKRFLPECHSRASHRIFDCSTLRDLFDIKTHQPHHALEDCKAALGVVKEVLK